MIKINFKEGKDNKYYFSVISETGQLLIRSQGYGTRYSAKKGLESVKKNSADASRFIRKESSNGKYYFILSAKNGEIIGTSPIFTSKTGREGAIISLRDQFAESNYSFA